jgi:hypothetical protein
MTGRKDAAAYSGQSRSAGPPETLPGSAGSPVLQRLRQSTNHPIGPSAVKVTVNCLKHPGNRCSSCRSINSPRANQLIDWSGDPGLRNSCGSY